MKPGPSARWLVSFALLACKSAHESAPPPPPPKPPGALQARELPPTLSVPLPSSPPPSSPPPISSEVVAFERQLQASKLRPPPHRARAAHLAFGRGVLAQLGANDWRIFELGAAGTEPKLLMREPVEAPRSLLALSDGSILAVTTRRLLRWEPSWKHPK
ncbi:MAG TPA: hypothetical protein VEQ58_17330, partial [Polyangiaceae bacterium]|nr:hypothetical protein [Polyangiaceae bacterium]